MVSLQFLLNCCEKCYAQAAIVAGPEGINGASLFYPDSGETVLCFRGTLTGDHLVDVMDWLKDFHANLIRADGFPGRVHAGFYEALNSLWPAVFDALEGSPGAPPLAPPNHPANPVPWYKRLFENQREEAPAPSIQIPWKKNLVICGHSKGGAVAQLAGVRLAALQPRVFSFAGPMTGDAEFAGSYPSDVSLTRIEGDYDLVPRLPPYLFGYHAAGKVIRQGVIPPELCEAAINRRVASGQWDKIHEAHSINTGYRPWVPNDPIPPAAQRSAA